MPPLPPTVRRDECGFVFLLVIVAMVVVMGFAALAVDGSRMIEVRTQLQATADGAALAAVSQVPNVAKMRASAREFAEKNMPAAVHGHVLTDADVVAGAWIRATRTFVPGGVPVDAVQITVRRDAANDNALPLTLARVVGLGAAGVSASAVASFGTAQTWDMVLVQDVTGSFSAEIADARTADQALLECFASHVGPESRFGVVTFTGFGQVQAPLQKITSSFLSLSSTIASIKSCGSSGMPKCSGTNIAAGLEQAVNMLVLNPPEDPETKQAIILVGDGQPESSSSGPRLTTTQLKNLAITWANNAAAADISVFVVFFDEANSNTAASYMQSLVRGDGIFLRTPEPAALPDLLIEICAQLPTMLVD